MNPNQGKKKSRWCLPFVLVGILLAILLIAVIWMTRPLERPLESSLPYYQLPHTMAPADWKTYTSSIYSYTFKYPPTWKFYDNSKSGEYDALYLSSPDLADTNDPYYKMISGTVISIEVSFSGAKDLKEVYDNVTLYFSDSIEAGKTYKSYDVYDKRYINLDGIKALRLDISRGDMVFGRGILVATVRNGKEYIIKLSQKDVNHTVIFDQILSTFKFAD